MSTASEASADAVTPTVERPQTRDEIRAWRALRALQARGLTARHVLYATQRAPAVERRRARVGMSHLRQRAVLTKCSTDAVTVPHSVSTEVHTKVSTYLAGRLPAYVLAVEALAKAAQLRGNGRMQLRCYDLLARLQAQLAALPVAPTPAADRRPRRKPRPRARRKA